MVRYVPILRWKRGERVGAATVHVSGLRAHDRGTRDTRQPVGADAALRIDGELGDAIASEPQHAQSLAE